MALSNWDILAISKEGPCNGVLNGHSGKSSIELYKNWLYLRDERMWVEESSFTKPTIAQIESGNVKLSDFQIYSKRGSQNSILCFVETTKYEKEIATRDWMMGIGCYGYDDAIPRRAEAMGINLEEWDDVTQGSCYSPEGNFYTLHCYKKDPETFQEFSIPQEGNEHLDSQWVGVTQETYQELIAFVEELIEDYIYPKEIQEWFDKIKSGEIKVLRFNQGDGFFEKQGAIESSSTPIGEQKEPFIMSLIKGIGDNNEEQEKQIETPV